MTRSYMKDDKIEMIPLKDNDDCKIMTFNELIDTFFKGVFDTGIINEEEDFWKKLEKTTSKS